MRIVKGTKRIGILFGDNDFFYTCSSFMKVLLPDEQFTHHRARDLTFTKEQVVELFNSMSLALYTLKQNAGHYAPGPNISAYLKINEGAVYLDDEVDKYMTDNPGGGNGEFFAVDFATVYVWAL
jgi:hypothetical protein